MDRRNALRTVALTLVPVAAWTSWPIGFGLAVLAGTLGPVVHRRRDALRSTSIALVTVYAAAALAAGRGPAAWVSVLGVAAFSVALLFVRRRLRPGDAAVLTRGVLYGALAQALLAVPQLVLTGDRALGTTYHANVLGSAAAFATVLGASVWLRPIAGVPRWLAVLGGVAGLAALVASGSRGAALAAIVGVLTVLIVEATTAGDRRRATAVAIGTALATLALMLAFSGLVRERIGALSDPLSLEGRTVLWRASLDLIRDRPWLGHGGGTWPDAIAATQPNVRTDAIPHPHNQALLWLHEAGALGFASWVAWWLALLIASVARRHHRAAAVGIGAGVAVHGIVEPVLSITGLALPLALWWAAAGAAAVAPSDLDAPDPVLPGQAAVDHPSDPTVEGRTA